MAIVDLQTKQIYDCKEGTKTWFHEKGHIEFNNTDRGVKINYYGIFFQMVAVFFIALSLLINNLPLKIFAFMNALGMLVCYIYEEVWCWAWGLKEWKRSKSNISNLPLIVHSPENHN